MTESRVFLIHGFEGKPNGGWRPWLLGALGRENVFACSLAMPTSDAPKKEEWIQEIRRAVGAPGEPVFLVGHSLGGPAILQYLATLPENSKIGGAILVSSPAHLSKDDEHNPIANFFKPDFDFDHIKKVCGQFTVIHGTDDPVVPFSDAKEISKKLSCELIPIINGKHLNGAAGIYELPEAFSVLMSFIHNS